MVPLSTLGKLAGIAGVAGLAVWGLATGREGSSFEVQPGSPSARAAVRFVDRTAGANAWRWDFGDGSGSGEQSPAHVYAQAGTYPVTLMVNGMATSAREVQVVNSTTLRLMSNTGNPFDITLHARDPRTGNEGEGEAIPQNDVFGYFTIPSLVPISPGAPLVPEVFVKMLDARAIQGQDFWLFWGGLTDLEYTLTVTDTVRGTFKTKTNPARPPGQGTNDCLGADTGGFAAGDTPDSHSDGRGAAADRDADAASGRGPYRRGPERLLPGFGQQQQHDNDLRRDEGRVAIRGKQWAHDDIGQLLHAERAVGVAEDVFRQLLPHVQSGRELPVLLPGPRLDDDGDRHRQPVERSLLRPGRRRFLRRRRRRRSFFRHRSPISAAGCVSLE